MTIREGQTIDGNNFIDVPPGSVLTMGSDRAYTATVLNHGYALRNEGSSMLYPMFGMTGWRVAKVGDWPTLDETRAQFLQRAWTVCVGAANDNGVRIDPVLQALRSVGQGPDFPLGVGMWLHIGDRDTRARLVGRRGLVYGYGNPNNWEAYAEIEIDYERVTVGGAGKLSRCVQVLAMEDPDTDIYLAQPTEEDLRAVARLRGAMWTIGVRAKEQERWCPQYEAAVGVLGISSLSATDDQGVRITAPIPTLTDASGRARLGNAETETEPYPVGAIFQYPSDEDPDYSDANYWNWQRRVEGGRWNTSHYLGPNRGQYGGNRTVLYDGVGVMNIPIHRNLMGWLPIGTRLSTSTGGGSYWYKVSMPERGQDHVPCWATSMTSQPEVHNNGFFRADGGSGWHIDQLPETHDGQATPL